MKLDLTFNRTRLIGVENKTDSEIFREAIIAALKLQEGLFQGRLMQRRLNTLLTGIALVDSGEVDLQEVDFFLLQVLFSEARFSVQFNELLVQIYDKLGL